MIKIYSKFIKKVSTFVAIIAVLTMTNQSFGSQVSADGKAIKISDNTLAIENLASETQKMFEALYVNDLKTVRTQLNKGVSANAKNDVGQTPLHVTQDIAILKILVSNGADVNSTDDDGRTPMFNKEIELITLLIEAGADIHHRSNKGNTLLIWYSYSGYLEGIQYIVSLGADVNAINNDGQTAHDIAERFAHLKLLEYLISIGAKPGE